MEHCAFFLNDRMLKLLKSSGEINLYNNYKDVDSDKRIIQYDSVNKKCPLLKELDNNIFTCTINKYKPVMCKQFGGDRCIRNKTYKQSLGYVNII